VDRRSRWARRNRTTRTYAIGDMLKCRWNPSCNVRTLTWHCFATVEVVSGRCGPASIMSIASRTAAGRPGSAGAASAWRYGGRPSLRQALCREIGNPEYLVRLTRFSSSWQICHFHVTKMRTLPIKMRTYIDVASQSPWRMAIPLPAALRNSHRNGKRVFLIFVADPITMRLSRS
jgi:hypothetical protein